MDAEGSTPEVYENTMVAGPHDRGRRVDPGHDALVGRLDGREEHLGRGCRGHLPRHEERHQPGDPQ
jgi:hypothetical protein